ncbi:MAG: sulfite exporter TauE/SafE family protein [Propionibacteriales bacterium]|nr:sulfite exporter TauE/SafE family protein [Propionibacteriales bacterium]
MEILAIAAVAIFVGAILQRVSGTGVGLVVAPTLTLVMGPANGVLLTNVVTVMSGFLIMMAVRRDIEWRKAAVIIPAAAVGAIPGALLVRELSPAWLQITIGVVVLLALATTFGLPRMPHVRSRIGSIVTGVVAGMFNTTAGVSAPVMVIHAKLSRWEQKPFQATLQPIFMMMGIMSVTAKTALGSFQLASLPPWWMLPIVVVVVLAGVRVGTLLTRWVPPSRARTLAIALAGVGGVLTLVRGLLALGN